MNSQPRPAPFETDFAIGAPVHHRADEENVLGWVVRAIIDGAGMTYAVRWADDARVDPDSLIAFPASELVYASAATPAEADDYVPDDEEWDDAA